MSEQVWTPPYIYAGLHDAEVLSGQPDQDHHVRAYRQIEDELYWRRECERGGTHRFGQCPYCRYYYD